MAITEVDRKEWSANPITISILATLKESRRETMESWAAECFIGNSIEHGALQNAAAIGGIRVLNDLIATIESYGEGEIA